MATKNLSTTLKTEAARPFYAVVGATDLAVELARGYATTIQGRVADVQTQVTKIERDPKALRDQALVAVATRVNELQGDVNETVADVNETYTELAARGENLVLRIRKQQATQDAKASARTTSAKAKTTTTQATKATKKTAKTANASAKRTAKTTKTAAKKNTGPAKSSTKATGTAAKKTAAATAKATSDAASKVGA